MKNFTIIITVFALIFSLSACSKKNTGTPPTLPPPVEGFFIDYEQFCCLTLKEYSQHFYSILQMPTDFISYDMIKELGEFDGLVFGGYAAACGWLDGADYSYYLVDEGGYDYDLQVDVKPFSNQGIMPVIQEIPNRADLRSGGTEEPVYYWVGSIRYFYLQGILSSITWETDVHRFTIDVDTRIIYNYDIQSNTFLNKLLNADTAEQAVAELNERIERNLAWNRFMSKATVPLIVVGILLLALVSYLVIRKNILRRKAKEKAILSENDSLQNDPPTDSNEPTPPEAATDSIT